MSKTSHGRVCLYLSSEEVANQLVEKYRSIKINEHPRFMRPLISKTEIILFSNVHPVIPNHLIEKKLRDLNISVKSQIQYIRANRRVESTF